MMRNVYVVADNIYSPLGRTTGDNIESLKQGRSGIQLHTDKLSPDPSYASLFDSTFRIEDESKTFFEQIVLASALDAIEKADIQPGDKKTGFILSSTKGNISLIENAKSEVYPEKRIALHTSASVVAHELGFNSEPLVVSHACISGLLAMITGMRLIQSGLYDTIVITGADLITSFIYSGFRSFQAISQHPCKPFDASARRYQFGRSSCNRCIISK